MSKITLYSTEWCSYCKTLKSAMNAKGIDFTEIDIENEPGAGATLEELTGGYRTVPTLDVCGKYLVNPNISEVVDALELCD